MTTTHTVHITPQAISVDGARVPLHTQGPHILKEVYRQRIGNYPKFFKMDNLCRLGFVASELLLQQEEKRTFDEKGRVPEARMREDRAVIFFNRAGSLDNDRAYQQTIASPEAYFPSPAIFVYTLPNIVTGEIAIRNRYCGETGFYVLPAKDEAVMRQVTAQTLAGDITTSVLGGWLEYADDAHFEADIYIANK
jgi:hypothetical protein